jgi:hypothetical protein
MVFSLWKTSESSTIPWLPLIVIHGFVKEIATKELAV